MVHARPQRALVFATTACILVISQHWTVDLHKSTFTVFGLEKLLQLSIRLVQPKTLSAAAAADGVRTVK